MARPESPSIVYLDSNALIKVVRQESGREPVEEILRLCQLGKLRVAVSMLAYVEVRGQGRSRSYDMSKDASVLAVLDRPNVDKVELSRHLARKARHFTMTYNLKNWDAVHLASAVDAQAEVFMTFDTDFKPLYGQMIEGIWVDEPYELGDPSLFGT